MMHYQTSSEHPPIPQRPSSDGIEISNVKEGETVHQVQTINWLHYSNSPTNFINSVFFLFTEEQDHVKALLISQFMSFVMTFLKRIGLV
jgi:hypothetical protein